MNDKSNGGSIRCTDVGEFVLESEADGVYFPAKIEEYYTFSVEISSSDGKPISVSFFKRFKADYLQRELYV